MKKFAFFISAVFLLTGCSNNEDKADEQKAIFSFDHVPSGAKGSFYMVGHYYPKTREMLFFPKEWIERPWGYITVGMKGSVLRDPLRYEGMITTEGCGAFSLKLIPQKSFLATLLSKIRH
jgi:hypothetical protein